ncbi:peptidoglycan-binding protein [Candidatus Giovannonibacteria bacterium]|nr:peptidoglycan-binding protein [Candidatus Giovannonibacteria bacterium]
MKKYLLTTLFVVFAVAFAAGNFGQIANAQSSTFVLQRDLYEGLSGEDVRALQRFLIQNSLLGAGLDTSYFGPLTKAAVMEMQKRLGVPSTGYVGPMTRQRLLSTGGSSSTTTPTGNIDADVSRIANELRNSFMRISSSMPQADMQNANLEQILMGIKARWEGGATFNDTFSQLIGILNQIANSAK